MGTLLVVLSVWCVASVLVGLAFGLLCHVGSATDEMEA